MDRVLEITVYEDDTATHAWDAATATAIATTFLPSDAVHVRDVPDEFPPPHYVEHVYRSKLLATSLDASFFVDEVDLKPRNPTGTFTWWCVPFPSNAPGYGKYKITVAAPKAQIVSAYPTSEDRPMYDDNDAPILGANVRIVVTIEQIAALARVIGCPITSLIQRM